MSGLPSLTHDRIPVQEQKQNTYCGNLWLFNFEHCDYQPFAAFVVGESAGM